MPCVRKYAILPDVWFAIRLKRRNALKEGFNVRNGNSLKAFGTGKGEYHPRKRSDVG